MGFHFVVRFDAPSAQLAEFRDELLRVAGPTRAEAGCLRYEALESIRDPRAFAIHSEWVDEAAFEAHSRMPHTVRFVTAAKRLLGGPVEGLRGREIGNGSAPERG